MFLTPLRALLIGGVCYGSGVYYMSKYYYNESPFKKIYVSSDPAFAKVKIMEPRDARSF